MKEILSRKDTAHISPERKSRLNPEDFKESILAVTALGATPAILVKAVELAQDPATDIDSICALLRTDGPLAADIIRISNSPYYAPVMPHANLNSAVGHIGLEEVLRIVNLSLAQQLFARDLASYGISARAYWSDSIATALATEALAEYAGLNPQDAHTEGILHAIGRLLINRVIEEKRFTIYWDEQQPVEDWEKESVGFDYAEAGAMLLERWHFPQFLCNDIRWQLKPARILEPRSLLGALQFSRRLLGWTGPEFAKDPAEVPDADPFMFACGITIEVLGGLVRDCREEFQQVLQLVDLS